MVNMQTTGALVENKLAGQEGMKKMPLVCPQLWLSRVHDLAPVARDRADRGPERWARQVRVYVPVRGCLLPCVCDCAVLNYILSI